MVPRLLQELYSHVQCSKNSLTSLMLWLFLLMESQMTNGVGFLLSWNIRGACCTRSYGSKLHERIFISTRMVTLCQTSPQSHSTYKLAAYTEKSLLPKASHLCSSKNSLQTRFLKLCRQIVGTQAQKILLPGSSMPTESALSSMCTKTTKASVQLGSLCEM